MDLILLQVSSRLSKQPFNTQQRSNRLDWVHLYWQRFELVGVLNLRWCRQLGLCMRLAAVVHQSRQRCQGGKMSTPFIVFYAMHVTAMHTGVAVVLPSTDLHNLICHMDDIMHHLCKLPLRVLALDGFFIQPYCMPWNVLMRAC